MWVCVRMQLSVLGRTVFVLVVVDQTSAWGEARGGGGRRTTLTRFVLAAILVSCPIVVVVMMMRMLVLIAGRTSGTRVFRLMHSLAFTKKKIATLHERCYWTNGCVGTFDSCGEFRVFLSFLLLYKFKSQNKSSKLICREKEMCEIAAWPVSSFTLSSFLIIRWGVCFAMCTFLLCELC